MLDPFSRPCLSHFLSLPALLACSPFSSPSANSNFKNKNTVEVAEYIPLGSPAGTQPTKVAVKRLRRGSALDAVDLAHEARVLKGLSHRCITKYIGVGASQSTRGKSDFSKRRRKWKKRTPFRNRRLCYFFRRACELTFFFYPLPLFQTLPPQKKNTGGPLIDEHCYIVQAFVGGGTLKRVVAAQTEATRASLSSSSSSSPSQSQPQASTSSSSSSSSPPPPSSPKEPPSPVGSVQCYYTHVDAARWGAQIAEGLAYLHGELKFF